MVLRSTYDPASNRLDPFYEAVDEAAEIHVNLIDGTYPRGTVLGEVTATPGTFKAYAAANTDGSQAARLLLRYGCTVAGGLITLPDEVALPARSVPAFYRGIFKTTDLVGLDAGALTALGGALISGTLANGVIRFG